MAITYPYALTAFADLLPISSVVWDVQRNDQLSGIGDGRVWQAELAAPLWAGDVMLDTRDSQTMKQLAALTRKLHGSQEAFFLYDPLSKFPQSDPRGLTLGGATVRINAIGSDADSMSLKGLPAGYVLTLGDKMQIAYSSDPVRYAFLEIDETVAASGGGITPSFGVFPHVPPGVVADLVVTLIRPACRVVIFPGSHKPGTARRHLTEGAAFRVIQKK